jgi:hypothetical protein
MNQHSDTVLIPEVDRLLRQDGNEVGRPARLPSMCEDSTMLRHIGAQAFPTVYLICPQSESARLVWTCKVHDRRKYPLVIQPTGNVDPTVASYDPLVDPAHDLRLRRVLL